jgi:hypothetical protein
MKLTQGALLASSLKRVSATYGDMQRWGISTAPQMRVAEWLALPANCDKWMLVKGKREPEGLVTWRIVRKPKGVD